MQPSPRRLSAEEVVGHAHAFSQVACGSCLRAGAPAGSWWRAGASAAEECVLSPGVCVACGVACGVACVAWRVLCVVCCVLCVAMGSNGCFYIYNIYDIP